MHTPKNTNFQLDDFAHIEVAVSCRWINQMPSNFSKFAECPEKKDLHLFIMDEESSHDKHQYCPFKREEFGIRDCESLTLNAAQTFRDQRELIENALSPYRNYCFLEVTIMVSLFYFKLTYTLFPMKSPFCP